MDAFNIADALVAGRTLSSAKVRRVLEGSDPADALYAALFQIVREPIRSRSVANAVAVPSPHSTTAEAWLLILRYAGTPSRYNYAKIVIATRHDSDKARTVIRLAPLVLAASHRRQFIKIVEELARQRPALAADLHEVCNDLHQRGPARLYGFRSVARAKRH